MVPYDDFAETDEPLECLEAEDSRLMSHHLWEDAAPLITTEEASQTAASALNNAEPLADTIKGMNLGVSFELAILIVI